MIDVTNISYLFFKGDTEFADSPAKINKFLYLEKRKFDLLFESEKHRVLYTYDTIGIAGGTRTATTLKIMLKQGDIIWTQPMYRSSGKATPEKTKAGEWLPINGIYTEDYCKLTGRDTKDVGFIGKKYYDPYKDEWIHHHKLKENLPEVLQKVCTMFNNKKE